MSEVRVTKMPRAYSSDTFVPVHNDRYPVDTEFHCKECGNVVRASFENAFKNGWPRCHAEGMHIGDTTAKIGQIMSNVTTYNGRNTAKRKDGTFARSTKTKAAAG